MSMANIATGNPRVVLETATGAVYDIPVYDLNGSPAPVNLQPIDPFDQVNVVGDTSKVADKRTDQIIPVDQSGGAGTDRYEEVEGVTSFRESDGDTHYKGVIVARAKRTSLGLLDGSAFNTTLKRIVYTGFAGATIVGWGYTVLSYWNGAAWVACAGFPPGSLYKGFCRGSIYLYATDGVNIYRSADGINFAAMAGGGAGLGIWEALCFHDNKLYAVNWGTTGAALWCCANPTAAIGATVWTNVATFQLYDHTVQAVVWKDASGSPALFILGSTQLFAYNAVGGTVEEYDDFRANNTPGAFTPDRYVAMAHFRTSGDLYVAQGRGNDYLMKYSPGAGYERVTPNRGGGLSANFRGAPIWLDQNAYGVGVWTDTVGWFLSAQGGWHAMDRRAGLLVVGGGMGNGKYWTAWNDGTVTEQDLPNSAGLPQFATGRKYVVTTGHTHTYAITDGGTTLSRKTLLGFTLHTLKSNSTGDFGLDASVSVQVEYKCDNGGWTTATVYKDTAGVLRALAGSVVTAAQTAIGFPVRLVVNNGFGLAFYEMQWRVTLTTTNEDQTPVVVVCAPRYTKTPLPHYTYDFVVNALDFQAAAAPAPGGTLPNPFGRSAAGMHQALGVLDALGTMVKLTFGAGRQATTDFCEFAMAPQLHPQAGIGRYRISLKSVDADPSG